MMKFADLKDVKKKAPELRRIVKAWIKMKS
jgi:hypothetical protein